MGINKSVIKAFLTMNFSFLEINTFLPPGFNRKKTIPALVSVRSWLDCMSSGSLLNAIRSESFLWSSADFTLRGLQLSLDLFCRSTQLARYLSTGAHSWKILLLNLGLAASLLLGCGVGVGWVFFSPSFLFPSFLSLCQSDSHHLGDLAQKTGAAWCGWYGQEARTFCVG